MENNRIKRNIKPAELVFIILGLLTIIIGFFATRERLSGIVINYLSVDKTLSEQTAAFLSGLQIKIILTGIVLLLLSASSRVITFLKNLLAKYGPVIIEKTAYFFRNFTKITYKIIINEKFIWAFIIVVLLTISLPTVYYAPAGGTHVEGIDLQQPKNLVRHGIYGTLTTHGFDKETHRTSAGPGILMPIALVFEIFGVSVYNGRFVHLFFLIGTILMFYFVVKKMFGIKVALLALLMSFTPYMIMLNRGHMGMGPEGYVPSLFYLLIGAHFWFKAIEDKKNVYLILSGLFFGFSFQTKWLFLFAIPALILTCIILSFTKNSLKSRYYVVPTFMVILVTAGWTLFRILNVGLRAEIFQLQKFWERHGHRGIGEGHSFFHPIIRAFTDNVYRINLWEDLPLFLLIPAFIYIFILIRKTRWTDYKMLFFINFSLIWFLWWMLFNVDLPEAHLRVVLIISQIFTAKLFYDVWQYTSPHKNSFADLVKDKEPLRSTMIYAVRTAIAIIVLAKVLLPLVEKANFLYDSKKNLVDPYNKMMTYIDENTEKNAVFSGWGWSMPWYVDINNDMDRINKDRRRYPPEQREPVPEYFIVSPEWPIEKTSEEWPYVVVESAEQKEVSAIRKKFLDENCTLIKTFSGDKHKWLLFKVNNENITQLSQQ